MGPVQWQSRWRWSLWYPQGHGFMAAASMKRAGKVSDMAARAMETCPSSSGFPSRDYLRPHLPTDRQPSRGEDCMSGKIHTEIEYDFSRISDRALDRVASYLLARNTAACRSLHTALTDDKVRRARKKVGENAPRTIAIIPLLPLEEIAAELNQLESCQQAIEYIVGVYRDGGNKSAVEELLEVVKMFHAAELALALQRDWLLEQMLDDGAGAAPSVN